MAIFLGIDPGLATVGFGVIESDGTTHRYIDCGIISTKPNLPVYERLHIIKNDLNDLLEEFKPIAVGVEELFFVKNVTNGIKVAQARGVILERLFDYGTSLFEFTPLEIKKNICGYGQADKKQMQEMVRRLLSLPEPPQPDDAADALGIAICVARVFESSLI